MARTKLTEEQIVAVLRDLQYKSERQRAIALGATPGSGINNRFKAIRKQYGIPEPEPARIGRPKEAEASGSQTDIKLYDTLTNNGVWYRVIDVDVDGFIIKRTDNYGDPITVHKTDSLAGKTGYKKRDLPPVKTYIDPSLKNKPPAFGAKPGDIKIDGTAIRDLPEEAKQKIVAHLAIGGGPKPEETPQPGSGGAGATVDVTKPAPRFEEVDYTDPDWGVTENPARCADCGRVLTPEERKYYEFRCEKCERRWMDVPDDKVPRREYLDRIDQLLDIMALECRKNPLLKLDVMTIAKSILDRGFEEEVANGN